MAPHLIEFYPLEPGPSPDGHVFSVGFQNGDIHLSARTDCPDVLLFHLRHFLALLAEDPEHFKVIEEACGLSGAARHLFGEWVSREDGP